jgi:predicted GNAT family N-acyltransferase
MRKNIQLELPLRFIDSDDTRKQFQNELSPVNNIDLNDLVLENHDNQYTIVYDFHDQVLAFVVLWDHGDHFELRLVEANRLYPTELHPGTILIKAIDDISRQFGYQKIVLDSTSNRVSYYKNLGYVEDELNEPFHVDGYGVLVPMIKWL